MRKYFIFGAVALPLFMSQVGSTSVAVAFPTMVTNFHTSLVLAGWVLSIYQLAFIAAIPVASRLSDTAGRKSTFMICLAFFTLGSFLCAIAPSIGWLIFFRVIQAVGGGGFVSAAAGIVSDNFPDSRHQFIGLLTSTTTLGAIVGPNLGGVLVQYVGWESIFWVNIPIGIAALVLVWYLIKKDVKKNGQNELDFVGIAMLSGFASCIMISLTLMEPAYHLPKFVSIILALLGILLIVLFFFRSKSRANGVVSRELLTRKPFLAANIYNFVSGACAQGGIMALIPLYGTLVYGVSAVEGGLLLTPRSVGMFLASIVASFSLLKWGYRRPLIFGSLTIVIALVLLATEPTTKTIAGITLTPVVMIMLVCLMAGLGAGVCSPASNNACIELMPDKTASITGLRQIARQMGGAIGISISTLVLQTSKDVSRGFSILLLSFAACFLVAIVAVFYMPERPVPKTQPQPSTNTV